MPLSPAVKRREVHHRIIDMKAYSREDGLFDVEARLTDRKPFPLQRPLSPDPLPAHAALHDLMIRLTVDRDLVIRAVEAVSDVTPYEICQSAASSIEIMVGEKIGAGWSKRVKERLRGAHSCTHLMEMLIPMGTTTLQGIRALDEGRFDARDVQGRPLQLDTCYAYSSQREVVQMLWPDHYRLNAGQS